MSAAVHGGAKRPDSETPRTGSKQGPFPSRGAEGVVRVGEPPELLVARPDPVDAVHSTGACPSGRGWWARLHGALAGPDRSDEEPELPFASEARASTRAERTPAATALTRGRKE